MSEHPRDDKPDLRRSRSERRRPLRLSQKRKAASFSMRLKRRRLSGEDAAAVDDQVVPPDYEEVCATTSSEHASAVSISAGASTPPDELKDGPCAGLEYDWSRPRRHSARGRCSATHQENSTLLAFACCLIMFGCNPFGFLAFVHVIKSKYMAKRGNSQAADQASSHALRFIFVGLIFDLLIGVVTFGALIMFGMTPLSKGYFK